MTSFVGRPMHCLAAMRDGVPTTVPHEAAKRVFVEAGMDDYRQHTTGYGMAAGFPPSWGEPVNMFSGNRYTLRAGMVVSIEPNLFIHAEHLGVRIIDNVLITQTGAELLSRRPRELVGDRLSQYTGEVPHRHAERPHDENHPSQDPHIPLHF